jgi:hypothetical protein
MGEEGMKGKGREWEGGEDDKTSCGRVPLPPPHLTSALTSPYIGVTCNRLLTSARIRNPL